MKTWHVVLGLAVVGVGGFLVYRKFSGNPRVENVGGGLLDWAPSRSSQPSNQYPFTPFPVPRLDTGPISNQPWFSGNLQRFSPNGPGIGSGLDQNFMRNVSYVKGTADIVGAVKDIWSDLGVSDWFNGGDYEGDEGEWYV